MFVLLCARARENMKRVSELEGTVTAIVSDANEQDSDGRFVHPFMREKNPFILTIFDTKDAFMEVLINRPVIFINILKTNKSLSTFWQKYEKNIWVLLLERLIKNEMGEKVVDTYPFFLFEHIATYGEKKALKLPMTGSSFVKHKLELGTLSNGSHDENVSYYFLAYDDIVEQTTQKDSILHEFIRLLLYVKEQYKSRMLDIEVRLSGFLGLPAGYTGAYIACLHNGFLFDNDATNPKFNFNNEPLTNLLFSIIMIGVDDLSVEWARKLLIRVSNGDPVVSSSSEATPLLIDRITTKKYRDKLYDAKEGLYNTPEKQRELFLKVLRTTGTTPDEVSKKYGHQFECHMCHTLTSNVDPLHSLAFCGAICRSFYMPE